MVKVSLFRSAALAALVIAGMLAAPAQAQRQERGGGDIDRIEARAEARQQRSEARAARVEARSEQRAQAAPEAPQARVEARAARQAPEARQARIEARAARQAERAASPQRNAPEGGWRSQRAGDGQRYGRNWDNNGTVSRPAPAWRSATPQNPERGEARDAARTERNRGYTGDRNRTYRDGYRDGRRADNRQDRVENRDAYRSGYRNGTRTDSYRDRRDQSYAYRNGYNNGGRDYRRWDRNDWRRDRRYNWSGYRNHNRSLFSIGRYYSPYRSYSYRRLSIGLFLGSAFYGNRYWINDPWQYRLPEVYGPYRWVRYYDDVLLVDIYSGEVVDVIHDFFW